MRPHENSEKGRKRGWMPFCDPTKTLKRGENRGWMLSCDPTETLKRGENRGRKGGRWSLFIAPRLDVLDSMHGGRLM